MPLGPPPGGPGGTLPETPRRVGIDLPNDDHFRRVFLTESRELLVRAVSLSASDCRALQVLATLALDLATGHSVNDFVDAFGFLTPSSSMRGLVTAASAIGIRSTEGNVNLNQTGQLSGFATKYRDSDPGGERFDQAHHFAFKFQLGYHVGGLEGALVGLVLDFNNAGDRELAGIAAAMGHHLKQTDNPSSVVMGIGELCDK